MEVFDVGLFGSTDGAAAPPDCSDRNKVPDPPDVSRSHGQTRLQTAGGTDRKHDMTSTSDPIPLAPWVPGNYTQG